jgi:hypothetical protein
LFKECAAEIRSAEIKNTCLNLEKNAEFGARRKKNAYKVFKLRHLEFLELPIQEQHYWHASSSRTEAVPVFFI